MKRIDEIKQYIGKKRRVESRDIQEEFNISRAMADRYLKQLIESNVITKHGKTKGAYYVWGNESSSPLSLKRKFSVENKDEDAVFDIFNLKLNLRKKCNKKSYEILRYGITEMVNNAIDHSRSKEFSVEVKITDYEVISTVRDYGIGIFRNIIEFMNLDRPEDAMAIIMKGKVTTYPEKHSGEGIFFTMKSADRFIIRSYRDSLIKTNGEIITSSIKKLKGTEVEFSISRNTNRALRRVFDNYAGKEFEYQFNKTSVYLNIEGDSQLISRSKAKRMIQGMNKFNEIEVDFKDIKTIGQGFAHEIFNVFMKNNADITFTVLNAEPPIKAMIKHTAIDMKRINLK
ncbi:MAG: DUF4325 domain-containing protein [candidate division WOR-3 bacterium]|nr:DUF4325 domain-containing protein [candidate division WOR-3 bacterium]